MTSDYNIVEKCCVSGLLMMALLAIGAISNKPKPGIVDPGYALPRKANIQSRDLCNDHHWQTVLEYDNKSYLLKVDPDGQPYIVPYKVEKQDGLTAKIVPLTPEEPEVRHGQ